VRVVKFVNGDEIGKRMARGSHMSFSARMDLGGLFLVALLKKTTKDE
jgi:hypothetical protein